MTIQGTLPWKRSVVDLAIIGGLALLFIVACASAFSMLVWDPAADPTSAAFFAVGSGRSGRVQPDQTQRVEKFGESRNGKILCSLIRAPMSHGHHLLEAPHKAGLRSSLLRLPGDKPNGDAG
jgi:hypothetical protein